LESKRPTLFLFEQRHRFVENDQKRVSKIAYMLYIDAYSYPNCTGADPGVSRVSGHRPLLRVPFLDCRNSIASKIDATHVIKAHSIIQVVFVMR